MEKKSNEQTNKYQTYRATYIICPIKINTVLHLIDSCICTWHFIWFSYINYKDADTLPRMQHTRIRLYVSLHLPNAHTQKHTHTFMHIQLNRIWTRNAITNNRNCTKEVNLIKCDRGCKATRSTDHSANKRAKSVRVSENAAMTRLLSVGILWHVARQHNSKEIEITKQKTQKPFSSPLPLPLRTIFQIELF